MSLYKSITGTTTEAVLVNSSSYSTGGNINISKIMVTNHGANPCEVSVYLDETDDKYIFKTEIPAKVTLVYDEEFSYPQTSTLKITTGNSNLTVIVD